MENFTKKLRVCKKCQRLVNDVNKLRNSLKEKSENLVTQFEQSVSFFNSMVQDDNPTDDIQEQTKRSAIESPSRHITKKCRVQDGDVDVADKDVRDNGV